MKTEENTVIMGFEPYPNLTIEMAEEMYLSSGKEKELANIFAIVENKAWWIEDMEYDYEEGTEEYIEAKQNTDCWFALADRIKEDIFEILCIEGIIIPRHGQIVALEPFMKRNGYVNGNGWWIPERG